MSYQPPIPVEMEVYNLVTQGVMSQRASAFDEVPTLQPAGQTIKFTDLGSWNGGDLEVTGYNMQGVLTIAVVAPNAATEEAFLKVTRLRNLGVYSAGSCRVITGASYGLRRKNATVGQLFVNATVDASAVFNFPTGTVTPTTPPNGSTHVTIWYT
jgi:hypothetical protein